MGKLTFTKRKSHENCYPLKESWILFLHQQRMGRPDSPQRDEPVAAAVELCGKTE
jgi:hypothetical protein